MRFRLDHSLSGMARRRGDVAFARAQIAVFVDGRFWDSCPEHAIVLTTRNEWWVEKLALNVERDRDTDRRLREQGWMVLKFWEHVKPCEAATVVEAAVASVARATRFAASDLGVWVGAGAKVLRHRRPLFAPSRNYDPRMSNDQPVNTTGT